MWLRMFFSSSTIRMVAIRSPARQLEREAAPMADLAVEPDPTAVGLDDVADDGEAEAGRSCVPSVGELREALEDPLALSGRDAGPIVGHRDEHGIDLGGSRDADRSAARAVAESVRDQVRERPGELGLVARD